MSEWVVLDISAITKTTNREKVLKILKSGGMTVCNLGDSFVHHWTVRLSGLRQSTDLRFWRGAKMEVRPADLKKKLRINLRFGDAFVRNMKVSVSD